jgi:Uma2 family endonuclease
MTPMSVAQRMTADEFLRLPPDPGAWTRELIDGEVVVNAPSNLHQYVLRDLLFALESWLRAEPGRGRSSLPLDVRLNDLNVFEPDVMWYADGRAPGRDDDGPSPIPDIAVEVRSPSTWHRDRTVKKPVYEQRGLPELWLVDTVAECVFVSRRSSCESATFDVELTVARGEALTSPLLLPGFALSLDDLFDD